MHISTEVENLYYHTIENIIADYFDLGFPDNSSLPVEFAENESGVFTLIGTKARGQFYISIRKLTNGKYSVYISSSGKIKKNKKRILTDGRIYRNESFSTN